MANARHLLRSISLGFSIVLCDGVGSWVTSSIVLVMS